MTERNPPVWMQSGTYNAIDDRLVTGLLSARDYTADGTLQGVTGGVVPPGSQLQVTAQGGTTMAVLISAGTVIVPATGINPPGGYVCYSEGTITKTLDIASGQPRIDTIYCEVLDQASGSDQSLWRVNVIKGTANSSPVAPTLPNTAVRLADVRVLPASQNGGVNKIANTQVRDMRRFASSLGGVHISFGGGAPLPAAVPGRMLYIADKKSLYVSDGSVYEPVYSYHEWLSYFRSLRPRQVSSADLIRSGATGSWAATLKKGTSGSSNGAVSQITNVRCPAGYAKVSLQCYGRLADVDKNNQAHVSVRVLDPSAGGSLDNQTVVNPSTARGVSFYSKSWQHIGSTFVCTGLPTAKNLTFRLEYLRNAESGSKDDAYFDNLYLMVEPGY